MDKLRCWKPGKRCLSVLLSVAMLLGMVALGGVIQAGATIYVEKQSTPPEIVFSAPETIYVNPLSNKVEFFAGQLPTNASSGNNSLASFGVNTNGTVSSTTAQNPNATTGGIHFWCGALDAGYPVTVERVSGPAGYLAGWSTSMTGGGANWNTTLYSNENTSGVSGLIVWKATYYSNGAQYTAYTYSWLHVPKANAISGMLTGLGQYSSSAGINGNDFWIATALIVGGTHSQDAVTGPTSFTNSNGTLGGTLGGFRTSGARSVSGTMQTDFWTNKTLTPYAGTPAWSHASNPLQYQSEYDITASYGAAGTGIAVAAGRREGVGNPADLDGRGGVGRINIDTSRYTNLNQIPQLKALGGVRAYLKQTINYQTGWGTANDYLTMVPLAAFTAGTNVNGVINYPLTNSNPAILRYRVNATGAVNNNTVLGIRTYPNKDIQLTARTDVAWTVRDKSELRKKLCDEIRSGIQIDTMGNKELYVTAIQRLATALCRPDHPFLYSNGTSSYALDISPDEVTGSLANRVLDQHELSKIFQGEAYVAKNVYYSSVVPGKIVVSQDDTINYYLGNSVYSKYNPGVSAPGYRPTPVGVNPPGTIPPSGAFLGGTSEAYEPWVGGVTITGANMTNRGAPNLSIATGLAKDAPDAINLNTKLTTGLQWNWFLEPIEYKIVYYPGSVDAMGTMAEQFVQYDMVGKLKPCAFVRPGWTFDYWEFNGNPYWNEGDEFSNMTTADNIVGGVSSDTIGVIACKAVWKQAEPEDRRLYFDPLGGTIDYMDGLVQYDGLTGLYYIDSNNHQVYGNLTQYLPLLSKPGYKHSGDWYFSSTCDPSTSWDRFTFRYLEDVPAGPGLIVYPKWVALSSTIRYNKNYSGNDGKGQSPVSQTAYTDQPVKLADRSLTYCYDGPLDRYGYDFLGWYPNVEVPAVYRPLTGLDASKLLGEGATYSYADLFGSITTTDAELMLHAVWQAQTYPLKFNVNWHDPAVAGDPLFPESPPGGMYNYVMATQNKVYGYTYGQSGAASGVITEWVADPVRFGWTFAGWYTDPDPTKGVKVEPGMTFTNIQALGATPPFAVREELFAHWISGDDVPIDPIMLHPKLGTFIGLAANTAKNFGPRGLGTEIDLTGLETGIIPPAGFKFIRWEMADGADTECQLIDVYDGTVTQKLLVIDNGGKKPILQAVWEEEEFTVVYERNQPLGGSPVVPALPFTLDHVTLSSYPYPPGLPLPSPAYTCDGFTLEGFTFDPNGTGTIFQDHKAFPAVAIMPRVEQVFDNAYRDSDGVFHLYAVWKKIGGLPPPGEFEPDDGDIPDKPGEPPYLVDPDGKDGYIVMYFTAPKDVVVTPAYQLQESRRFLEYDKPYGKMPTAQKTDGIFVGWRVIKYGSNGSLETPAGLLGKMINSADPVKHIYSIWVAPVFEPGYVVTYVANGGTIEFEGAATETRRVVFPTKYGVSGQTYGAYNMPSAIRQDYKFLGWYTQPVGGQLVTASTVIDPSGRVGGINYAPGQLTNINNLPVTDILFAQWEKTTSTGQDIWNGITGWLSSDSLAHLPNWANLTLLGIGLPLLGITTGTFASLTTATIFLASFLGLLFFPLAFMLPFLFPVIAALMPVWWPLILIL